MTILLVDQPIVAQRLQPRIVEGSNHAWGGSEAVPYSDTWTIKLIICTLITANKNKTFSLNLLLLLVNLSSLPAPELGMFAGQKHNLHC